MSLNPEMWPALLPALAAPVLVGLAIHLRRRQALAEGRERRGGSRGIPVFAGCVFLFWLLSGAIWWGPWSLQGKLLFSGVLIGMMPVLPGLFLRD